ncbi:glucose-6-phosphate isomerase [Rubrobacter indicoceani]|uniref:glucose-6-phosphate isomerase n=1 Tax=Rubrobacter indicoceani TaxID=2051957 RepID=UPI000E5C0D62|nr:glucose-6-phosphate isomerase [Rubrobacter indicoceani]
MIRRHGTTLGQYEAAVSGALSDLRANRAVERMLEGDHTLWGPEPDEIADRLGWLESPETVGAEIPRLTGLADELRSEGTKHILLMGMGGSSLAPEVFGFALGGSEGYPDLTVLDSTDPQAVRSVADTLDLSKTVFIVSTKSGGTVETFSFFKFFYNRVEKLVDGDPGLRFIAITDPGSGLQETAERYSFRETFLNDPDIGGRYSALSFFGMVPTALIGADVEKLLDSGAAARRECSTPASEENPGAYLGAAMGELARNHGRDKLTFFTSPLTAPFGPWVEQLIAESTGKDGVGILPVAEEPPGSADAYGDDRVFVKLALQNEAVPKTDDLLAELRRAGHPVVEIMLEDPYELAGEMMRWEVATAISGERLGINPFDQPNVESAKVQARNMLEAYRDEGGLPALEPTATDGSLSVFSAGGSADVSSAIEQFFSKTKAGDYIALQAYLPPGDATTEKLQALRGKLRDDHRLATTFGYGPRFLHSTGQLHKGDGGGGLFVQITADHPDDAGIPDEAGVSESSVTFGVLIDAQALGDRQALLDNDRRFIRVHLGSDVEGGLHRLADILK